MTHTRKIAATIATLALATVTGGCASASVGATSEPGLQTAYDTCSLTDLNQTVELADGGHTLLIDTGDDDDIDGAACIFIELGTPSSVISQIDSTSALMGRQDAEAGGYFYSWSYHPDTGMQMVITD